MYTHFFFFSLKHTIYVLDSPYVIFIYSCSFDGSLRTLDLELQLVSMKEHGSDI